MRFLVDECAGPAVAEWLHEQVFREQKSHHGVILLRVGDERAGSKIDILAQLLRSHADRLPDQFVVVTEKSVRFARH